jgi:hypothetical protein
MQKFLKSAVAIAAMVVVGTSAFAADKLTAKLKLTGNLYGTNGFTMDSTGQQYYDDTFFLNYSSDKAGADFRIAFKGLSDADKGSTYINSTAIWFKPFDMLKITIGQNDIDRYKEQIDWWRAPSGWVTSDGSGGLKFDITATPELAVQANVTPGYGKTFLGYDANTQYGINASYNVAGFGKPRLAFADQGNGDAKQVTIGTDINAIPGLYAFENIGIKFDGAFAYSQVAFDTYVAYTADKLNVKLWLPITMPTTGLTLGYIARVNYAVSPATVYFRTSNGESALATYAFAPEFQLGAETSIDKVWLDAHVLVNLSATGTVTWALPFTAKLSF